MAAIMTRKIYPLILCGGSGTRLWPVSRKSFPKQFTRLIGDETLFQAAVRRTRGEIFADPIVITSNDFRFIVVEQMAEIGVPATAVIIEPMARNTAPAVLAASLWLKAYDPDGLILVLSSDQVIPDGQAFHEAVSAAASEAHGGNIITFGIKPDRPETGYGYLELATGANALAKVPQRLAHFIEKPTLEKAEVMIASGKNLWNAGIFLFSVNTIFEAFHALAPALVGPVSAAVDGRTSDLAFTRLAEKPWLQAQAISLDYAIMERAKNLMVMPFSGHWSDLGSWAAVWQETGPDSSGNVTSAHAIAIDCSNTLLRSDADTLELVGIGLEGIIAVATPDGVVVARKQASQRIGEAVAALKAKGAKQAQEFPREHRPWGWFESLAIGSRFQVKRIVVNPGGLLSLQSHFHRSEHWIVVQGTAKVTINNAVKLVSENESVYIPLGAVHRMENPGVYPMVLIEVQTGSYLGEDDIVRYDDVYARK